MEVKVNVVRTVKRDVRRAPLSSKSFLVKAMTCFKLRVILVKLLLRALKRVKFEKPLFIVDNR